MIDLMAYLRLYFANAAYLMLPAFASAETMFAIEHALGLCVVKELDFRP